MKDLMTKVKFNGRKIKVKFLNPSDIIEKGDICSVALFDNNPLCYEQTIQRFLDNKNSIELFYSECIGDTVSDWHTTRVYLRPINFNTK